MKQLLKIMQPLAWVMLAGGFLLGFQGFVGSEPMGEVGRQFVDFRWHLVVIAAVGAALIVAHRALGDGQ